ncbi:MAG: hypothetical protein MZW92_76490 [Comamonadaceae bacterium]|nr:hypothetical protein [Comamonadaceae bacterium]
MAVAFVSMLKLASHWFAAAPVPAGVGHGAVRRHRRRGVRRPAAARDGGEPSAGAK